MKKLLSLLTALIILSSCEKEINFDTNTYPQKWELVSVRGSISGAKPLTGDAIQNKETYVLNADSTFIKTKVINQIAQTASGIFSIENLDNKPHFVFKYSTRNNLIGSCGSLEEYLVIESKSSMNNNWWQACDGPGLGYERVQ